MSGFNLENIFSRSAAADNGVSPSCSRTLQQLRQTLFNVPKTATFKYLYVKREFPHKLDSLKTYIILLIALLGLIEDFI